MGRGIARLAPVLLTLGMGLHSSRADTPAPEESRLRAHVNALTAPEMLGRNGAGGKKAAEYLTDQFQRIGLEPLFKGSFYQDVPGREGGFRPGRNVGGILRGSDPKLRDEWIILSAHYDHLGARNGVIFPGADDNASGVAMMLDVARALINATEKPRRSLMFIGFDLEEAGLFGSRYFVEHAPVPLEKVALFVTADMIGRSLAGVCEPYVFVMGSEHAPGLRSWIEAAGEGKPLTIGTLGSDILLLDRSDYGPFRTRQVPYLFFSTGENPTYHTPQDVPETLNYAKLTAISQVILGVVARAADAPEVPRWTATQDLSIAEAITIRNVLRILLEHRKELKVGATQRLLMSNALKTLDVIVARGAITAEERTGVVRVARLILFSVL